MLHGRIAVDLVARGKDSEPDAHRRPQQEADEAHDDLQEGGSRIPTHSHIRRQFSAALVIRALVQLSELKTRAAQKALARPEAAADEADRLGADLSNFFGKVPEPPVYRRREDPARAQAVNLLAE